MAGSPVSSVRGGFPLGLTGATAATRYVGATASGAPASGTFAVGDFCIDQTGLVYVCTVAGSPGTWVGAGAGIAADGWVSPSETWTYASATTFTIAGVNVTAKYPVGTRIKFTQSAAVKYFIVASAAFSTDTTVTIVATSDYTLANAAITANYYSYEPSPQGFPNWFAFTLAATGWTTPVGSVVYCIVGGVCYARVGVNASTSNSANTSWTLPIAANAGQGAHYSSCRATDNGAVQTTPGVMETSASSTTCVCTKSWAGGGGGWTASGNKSIFGTMIYPV